MTIEQKQHAKNTVKSTQKIVPDESPSDSKPTANVSQNDDKVVPDLSRIRNAYKEGISLVKDTLDVAWKLAPLAFLPASLFLWVYLRSIHWTIIFQDSAMSGAGLIFLFVAAALMAFAVVLQFVTPSLLIIATLSVYRYDRAIPKALPRLYRWATGGWIVGLSLLIGFDSSQAWIVFGSTLLGAALFALTHIEALELNVQAEKWPFAPQCRAIFRAVLAALTMFATSLPLLLALHAAEHYAEGGLGEKALAIGVCAGTSLISLVPGYMYLNARSWSAGALRPLKFGLLGAFFLAYVVLAAGAFLVPISSTVLRLAGVYSNESQTFQVVQPNLMGAFSTAHLPIYHDETVTYVTAYVRYGFGGTRLLCRAPFNPDAITREAVTTALRNKLPDPGLVAGSGCVPVSLGEVRPFRL